MLSLFVAGGDVLPLLSSHGKVLAVDDDRGYLESLALTLSGRFDLSVHSHPSTFDATVACAQRFAESEKAALLAIVDAHADGSGCLQQVLRYFASADRFQVASVAILDYSMPTETGVDLAKRHADSGLQRILLTGQADTEVAVNAFNIGSIEMYIPKGAPGLLKTLRDGIVRHLHQAASRRGACLDATLSSSNRRLLQNPAVVEQLQQVLASHDVVEHMVVGSPLGVMGISSKGHALWFQLESMDSLTELSELIAAVEVEPAPGALNAVVNRTSTVSTEIADQIPSQEAQVLELTVLNDEPYLAVAALQLSNLPGELTPIAYDAWRGSVDAGAPARGAL